MNMELTEDLIMDIISRLPVNLTVRCKVLNKSFNNRLCEPNLSQTYAPRWFQQQNISKLLLHSTPPPLLRYGMSTQYRKSKIFRKISSNPSQGLSATEPLDVSILASCNGLLLLQFHDKFIMAFCLFNPITGLYQLISYPQPKRSFKIIDGGAALIVDYPTSNRYKLVTIGKLDEHEGYKFHVYSSEEPRAWHEIQFRTKLYDDVFFVGQPVYVHDCLHWLRKDGCILVFDTTSEHGRIINSHIENENIIRSGNVASLGVSRGVLNVVIVIENRIVIYAYDNTSGNWTVSRTFTKFYVDGWCLYLGFPKWVDGKKLLFLVKHLDEFGWLYEYDFEIKGHRDLGVVENLDMAAETCVFSFEPTLAYVPKTQPYPVHSGHLPTISTILDALRYLIVNKPIVARGRKASLLGCLKRQKH